MKYLLDIISVFIVSGLVLLTAQRPVIDLNARSPVADKRRPQEITKEEMKKVEKGIVRGVAISNVLKERNIFSLDGRYSMSEVGSAAMKGPVPQSLDTLIGILQGQEKKAVFQEYTGSIVTLTEGKKLLDGFVITRIGNNSVEVKKGKEKKELRIFEVKVPRLTIGKKP